MRSSRLFVFLGSFLAAFVALAFAYVLFVNAFCRGRMENDPWLPYVYWHKLRIAQETPSPKIVIMGGSASLFSIHSDVISQMTGMPVVNMAMHAGIPFGLYDSIAKRCVGPGDVVILPLEFQHYFADESYFYQDLALATLFGMDQNLQASLTFSQRLKLYVRYGYSWMQRLSKSKHSKRKLHYEAEIEFLKGKIERINGEEWKCDSGSYSVRHCNEYGDMWIPFGLLKEIPDRCCSDLVKQSFLAHYERLLMVFEHIGAKAVLSFPNLNRHTVNGTFAKTLPQQLQGYGISIIGSPLQFCFPDEYYYDSTYHMNQAGGEIYSIRLGAEICKYLKRTPKVIPSECPEKVPCPQFGEGLLESQGWIPISGFWEREGDFRWTIDTEAEVQVLADTKNIDDGELTISLMPLIIVAKNVNEQLVRVKSMSGRLLKEFRLTAIKRQDVAIPVTLDMIENRKIKLKFEFPNAISPQGLGLNNDTRKLGVKVYEIKWGNKK